MKCPICQREVPESERDRPHSFYPFCSQRCKLIDLGRWLGGKYQIPMDGDDSDANQPADREEQE